MDNAVTGRAVRFLLLLAVLGFLLLLLDAQLRFPAADILARFRWTHSLWQALARLIEFLVPIQISAVLFASSLPAPKGRRDPPGRPFHALAVPGLFQLLVLTLIYAALVFGILPAAHRTLGEIRATSRLSQELRRQMSLEKERSDYARALALADRARMIDPDDKGLLQAQTELRMRVGQAQERGSAATGRKEDAPARPQEMTAQELLGWAEDSLGRGDAYSAHYYAVLAQRLDPGRREAFRLAARAQEQIAARAPDNRDRLARALFERKQAGHGALLKGEAITAYRIFRELEREVPGDPDVVRGLEEARRKVQAVSFFIEDAERVLLLTGYRRILFVNDRSADERELVYLDQLAETPSGVYVRGIEAIRFRASGEVVRHLRAPLGRLVEGQINLQGISVWDGTEQVRPTYLAGTPPKGEAHLLPLAPAVEILRLLQLGGPGWAAEGLRTLWSLRPKLDGYGWGRVELEREIFHRLLLPFSFLILSLLALSMGWSLRAGARATAGGNALPAESSRFRQAGRLPLASVLLAPVVPLSAALAVPLYAAACSRIFCFLLLALGFPPALLALLAIQLLLLLGALVLLAGRRTEDR
jgi:hypothetical protein